MACGRDGSGWPAFAMAMAGESEAELGQLVDPQSIKLCFPFFKLFLLHIKHSEF